jgi:hypothetical protein
MEISPTEKLAIDLIKNYPELIKPMLTPEGNLEINRIYDFYSRLHRQLEVSYIRRKNLYEDVQIIQ